MSNDETPSAIKGLGWGLWAGLFPAILLGLGHGLFSWDSSNILPTAFIVDVTCGGIGLVGAWLFGISVESDERKEREKSHQEGMRKQAEAQAKKEAEIAEFNWSRGQRTYTLEEVVQSLDELFSQSAQLTDVQWGTQVNAWGDKYAGSRITGVARVENVAQVNYEESKSASGCSGKVLLRDTRGKCFTYFIGPNDNGYMELSKGTLLRFDGKILSNLRHYWKQMDETNMFMVVGWK